MIISISGMRGIIGENLTAAIAAEYGCAFGTFLKENCTGRKKLSVCIGRDSRPSGQMLESAVTVGLCSVGIDVVDLGIVTTPGVGIMARHLGCGGGVIITASHNPIQYNGIKLLLGNGIAPPQRAAEKIKGYFLDKKFAFVDSPNCGKVTVSEQTDDIHIAKVLAIVDKKTIAGKKFKVVLDSVNGAGGRVTKKLLSELGCKVYAVNDEPTGLFAHTPEPTAENLRGLCGIVKAKKVDAGFAQDPDADRLAVIDENGFYIGEEYTLALAAKYIFSLPLSPQDALRRGKKKGLPRRAGGTAGSAATNLSTSRMIDDVAEKAGGKVFRTPVGEANVAAAMLEHKCVIGGEGNGGVIDLRVGPIRDSLVGIALILQLMAEAGKTVSELAGEIGGYYMSKDKFAADKSQAQKIMDSAKKLFAGAKLNTDDGCRFDFDDGWLHLRTSNTEPVMRIIVEAKDKSTAQKYIDAVLDIRKKEQKGSNTD